MIDKIDKIDKDYLFDTINYLIERRNLGLLALNITKTNNTKDDYENALNDGWKYKGFTELKEVKKHIYKGIVGFLIKTGIKNDIVCIDWDKPKQHIADSINLINEKIKNGETLPNENDKDMIRYDNHKKSLNIRDELLKLNTLYAKTPSGGFHFIVKYDGDVYIKNNRGILDNIDIRTEGGLIFFGIRNDGRYEYIKNEIKETPKKLIKVLKPLISKKQKDKLFEKVDYVIDDKYNKLCDATECCNKYDINESTFKCYIEMLLGIEPKYLDDYKEWFIFTIICKQLGLGFKDLWDIFSKKGKGYKRKENRKYWNYINVNTYDVDINYIVAYLKEKHNIKLPKIQTIYYHYKPITNYEGLDIENINTQYLSEDIYKISNRIIIVNSGVCTAKTTSLFNYAINNKTPIISIVHLKNLGGNQEYNFNDKCKKYYKNTNDYERYKGIMYDDKKGLREIRRTNTIFTTINNLTKILKASYENIIDYKNPYDVDVKWNVKDNINNYLIFLDEGGRQIHNLYSSQTLAKRRIETIDDLKYIIENSKKVVASDGTIDDLTLDYFNQFNDKPKYYINSYKSYSNPFKFYNSMGLSTEGVFEDEMIKLLDAKKWFMIACNTKCEAVYYRTFLLNTKKISIDDIVFYTADDGNDVVKNATEEWKNKVIIFSPSIVEGVDFVPDEPIAVFSIINGTNTINAEQIKQQICRARKISIVHICVCKLENRRFYGNADEIHNDLMKNINNFDKNLYYEKSNTECDNSILTEFNNFKQDGGYDEENDVILREPTDDCRRYTKSLFIDTTNKQNIIYTIRNILEKIGMYEQDNTNFIRIYSNKKLKEKEQKNTKKTEDANEANEADEANEANEDKRDDYIYQVLPRIEETEEYKLFKERKIYNSKEYQLYEYLNNTPDTDKNIKFRKYLEGNNYPEPTDDDIGRFKILGITKYFLKELLYGNKELLKAYDNTFKEKEKDVIFKTRDNLMDLIYNESQSYEKYYTNIKFFIMDDDILDDKIKCYTDNDIKNNVMTSIPYKVKNYKYFMRKYADMIEWFNFNYKTTDKYIQEDINISIDDFNRFKTMRIKSTKPLDTIRSRKDFLNNMMMPLLSDIIAYSNITKLKKCVREGGKVITGKIYYINPVIRKHILLYYLGQKLQYETNDDETIKYKCIDDDIIKCYMKDLEPFHLTELYKWFEKVNWVKDDEEDV